MGRLSDSNTSILARSVGAVGKDTRPSGRRACLYIGTIATIFGLVIAISVDSLQGLWLSMIPSALVSGAESIPAPAFVFFVISHHPIPPQLQHNFDVFKALLSEYCTDVENGDDKSSEEENQSRRSGSVGKLGMCAGLSFMVGPMVAAVLSPSFKVACIGAVVLTAVSGIVLFNMPMPICSAKSKSEGGVGDGVGKTKQSAEFSVPKMIKLETQKSRAAAVLLVTRLMMALAFHIFNTIWPASLKSRFAFGPQDHAKFMSFVGISYAFSQGVVAKFLVKTWGRSGKVPGIMLCCAILGAGRYIAYHTGRIEVVYATFFLIINALGTLNTILTADSGAIAPREEVGSLFGILQAAESGAGIIGPFIGGLVSRRFGTDATLLGVVFVYAVLFLFVSSVYKTAVMGAQRHAKPKEA